ncbi:MAG: hypothetical protein KBC21_02570 [Candidatus Pacebacteria bacterium]|nr:hypothetical protein [Candidatus Paceibacterota bacterium]
MYENKKKYWPYLLLLLVCSTSYAYFSSVNNRFLSVKSFEDCVKSGSPILDTYPEECKIPGKTFVNKKQSKEAQTKTEQTEVLKKNFLNYLYLVNGTPSAVTSLPTATSSLIYSDLMYESKVNGDTLKDILFIAHERKAAALDMYYLLLALGLYNGELAPANGIALGGIRPTAISVTNDNKITVTFFSGSQSANSKTFVLKNGILEESE